MRKIISFLFLLLVVASFAQPHRMMSAMVAGFNPANLSPAPVLFINPYIDTYTTTVDNNGTHQIGNIIDSATAYSGQTLSTSGVLTGKPIYNGEGWYFEQGAQMTTGTTSSYNFIHNGSDFDISVTAFFCPPTATNWARCLLTNNGFSSTAKGIFLQVSSVSGSNTLICRVGNGSVAMINSSANNAVPPNATSIIRVRRSGNDFKMYVNGTQVATQTISQSAGTGDAAGTMTIGSNTSATANIYLKDVVILDRVLTASEITKMNSRKFKSITPQPINVYLYAGDSNAAGQGLNASIAGDLTGNISGAFAETWTSLLDYSSWPGKLLLGTNQNIQAQTPGTYHGAEMRFGKNIGANGDVFILKYGVGSQPLFERGTNGDWNAANSNSHYVKWTQTILPVALNDIVHVYRRTPVFRGFIWVHGANDCYFGGQSLSWTRSGTTATITHTSHAMLTQYKPGFYGSSDTSAIPTGSYSITKIDNNSFSIQVPNAGATSGTISYTGGYYYKENLTAVINGTIDYLTSTIKNQITNGTGYTVDKLRIYVVETKSGASSFNSASYTHTLTGQQSVGSSYLSDNPSRTTNVKGSTSVSTESLSTADGVHYTTSALDSGIGVPMAAYFSNYINE